jgi:hypothetical protein
MTTYEIRAHIGPDGTLIVRVPAEFEDSDVRVLIEKHPGVNGVSPSPAATPLPRTTQERADALDRIAGSINDPTFDRPA